MVDVMAIGVMYCGRSMFCLPWTLGEYVGIELVASDLLYRGERA